MFLLHQTVDLSLRSEKSRHLYRDILLIEINAVLKPQNIRPQYFYGIFNVIIYFTREYF